MALRECLGEGAWHTKNTHTIFGRMGILLIVFSGELVSNWYPVSIFEEPKSPKSLIPQGFSDLIVA